MSSATENRKNFTAQVGAETSVIPIPTGYLNLPNPTSLRALIINPDMGCNRVPYKKVGSGGYG